MIEEERAIKDEIEKLNRQLRTALILLASEKNIFVFFNELELQKKYEEFTTDERKWYKQSGLPYTDLTGGAF